MPDEIVDDAAEAGPPLEAPAELTLDILRHSAAHLMAAAVIELFPGAQYDVGPATEEGFFYNFRLADGAHFAEEDLARIETRMKELAKRRIPFEREEMSRDEARQLFTELGQGFKVDIINRMGDGVESVGVYRTGEFVDLCRGPHVPAQRTPPCGPPAPRRGRVLARRRAQRAAPAGVRHRVLRPRAAGRIHRPARGGPPPRPPAAGRRARPLPRLGALPGFALLASQGDDHLEHARGPATPRERAGAGTSRSRRRCCSTSTRTRRRATTRTTPRTSSSCPHATRTGSSRSSR